MHCSRNILKSTSTCLNQSIIEHVVPRTEYQLLKILYMYQWHISFHLQVVSFEVDQEFHTLIFRSTSFQHRLFFNHYPLPPPKLILPAYIEIFLFSGGKWKILRMVRNAQKMISRTYCFFSKFCRNRVVSKLG